MKEKTLLMIEQEINDFFKSDKCKELITKYYNDNSYCTPPYSINVFIEDINNEISKIDPHIFVYCPKDSKSDLLFCENSEGVLLKFNLPDGQEMKEYIRYFMIDVKKSSIGSINKNGDNLQLRFDSEFISAIPTRGFYTERKNLVVSDVINLLIKRKKKTIIKELNAMISNKRNEIKELKKEIEENTERRRSVRQW